MKKFLLPLLLTAGLSSGAVVEWKDRPLQVKVPEFSVLTVELPCEVLNVAHLTTVQTAFSKKKKVNSVHIAVEDSPTSVGITCEEEGVVRSYNLFIEPSQSGGTTYVKIEDPGLRVLIRKNRAEVSGRKEDSSVLSLAKSVMRAMLTGKPLFGFRVEEGKRVYREAGFEMREVYVYTGRLTGILLLIKNISPMKKAVHPSMFADRGVILVWLEGADGKETVIRPGEERYLAVVKLSGFKPAGAERNFVLPVRVK